ncbi:GAF domain-containing protein [Algoriphagus sp.]|uniref:GAF domain-containing protein n=1 Tax=Algoriphagus sp. TaxID=1872435 RepID=UPI0025F8B6E6|nr:GAF domain-containing protein [Algoriphagus sp.]
MATVAVQLLLSIRFDNKAEEAQVGISYISELEHYLLILNNDTNRSASGTIDSKVQKEYARFTAQIQKFIDLNMIDYQGQEFEISEHLMDVFDTKLDTENSFKELLSELLFKLKMNNQTFRIAIQKLNKRLSKSKMYLEQQTKTLGYYRSISVYILFLILGIELLAFILFLKTNFFNGLKKGIEFSRVLANGNENDKKLNNGKAEIGILFEQLNKYSKINAAIGRYLNELLAGNSAIELSGEIEENELIKSLSKLSTRINHTKLEEEQTNWMNVGLAKFSEVLQSQHDDIEKFGDQLISELVRYVGANQGAIFTIEETKDNRFLQLLSTYAWGKKRYVENQVTMDSGNLMVQAIKESEHIYIKEIPDGFVNITSGLGDANPKALLIVPLIINNKPLGVIELATFKDFDDYKIDFIIKVCENISSTFSAIASAINTKKLLENSQAMTEQLRAQEEELRQNAEELEASRENLHRELELAKKEMQGQVEHIESEKLKNIAILEGCVDGVVIFKEDGIVDFFNKSAEEIWSVSREDIIGKSINKLLPLEFRNEQDNSCIYYTGGGQYKEITVRTEITSYDQNGNENSLLVTSSQGSVKGVKTYAFFVQTITVELF